MAMGRERIYNQSAVIPYFEAAGNIKVVLITSLSSKNWILPKGIVEPNMTPQDSAAKEALEEAGIVGVVSDELIGQFEQRKWGGICRVRVYPLKVTELLDEWDEMESRERAVVDLDTAIGMVKQEMRGVLEAFSAR